MSDLKTTPGPWAIRTTERPNGGFWRELMGGEAGEIVIGELYEDRFSEPNEPTVEEAEANAALIAAAPEMIEALYQYESDLLHPPTGDSVARRLDRVRKVIAKALAREQSR